MAISLALNQAKALSPRTGFEAQHDRSLGVGTGEALLISLLRQ